MSKYNWNSNIIKALNEYIGIELYVVLRLTKVKSA